MTQATPKDVSAACKAICDFLMKRAIASEGDLDVFLRDITAKSVDIQHRVLGSHQQIALTGHIQVLTQALQSLPMIDRLALRISFHQASPFDCEMEVMMLAGNHNADMSDAPALLEAIASHLTDIGRDVPDTGLQSTYWIKCRLHGDDASQAVHATNTSQAVRFYALMDDPLEPMRSVTSRISGVHLVCANTDWQNENLKWSVDP